MALLLKSRKKQAEQYSNYEQQAPQRDLYFRQANPMDNQGYAQSMMHDQYAQYTNVAQPVQNIANPQTAMPQQNYNSQVVAPQQTNTQQGFVNQPQYPQQQYYNGGYYQNQASQYLSNGWTTPQQNSNAINYQQQYQNEMVASQIYDYNAYVKRAAELRNANAVAQKKNINSDAIKVVITIMVLVVAVCAMLIANQFISTGVAAANSQELPAVNADTVANAVTSTGTETINQDYTIPSYEYETSTNWFDKFCDLLGGKLN